jgi:RsiW-degrading membrane proteinase PrsW (M82 family)
LLLTSVLITVVPVFIYLWILWKVDRHEKEPRSLLTAAVVGGAVVAPAIVWIVENVLGAPSSIFPARFQAYGLTPPNMAGAVIEELAKAVVVVFAYVAFKHEYDGTLDGVVYGAAVGAGFALAETVSYLQYLPSLPAGTGFSLGFFVSIFRSGLTHCVFTAIFGAALGYVRETGPTGSARTAIPVAGLVAAILYHVAYVGFAASGQAGVTGGLAVLFALGRTVADWSGIALLALVVLWALGRERDVLQWALADETGSGAMTADDVATLRSSGRLTGAAGLREALGELAFAKWRLSRGRGAEGDVDRWRRRVLELRGARQGGKS